MAGLPNYNIQGSSDLSPTIFPKSSDAFAAGDAVMIDTATGLAVEAESGAGLRFVGWADFDANATATTVTVSSNTVKLGLTVEGTGSDGAIEPDDLLKTVYCTGPQSYTVIAPNSNPVPCGTIARIRTVDNVAPSPGDTFGQADVVFYGIGGIVAFLAGPAVDELTDNSGGTPSDTLAAQTLAEVLTDSSGGTPATTIAAITNAANAGSADVGPTANAIASLATQVNALTAQNTVLRNTTASLAAVINDMRTAMVAAGLIPA